MKIKVAILGYGNLGKAIEQQIISNEPNIKLVAIFTKRDNLSSAFNTPIFNRKYILKFKNDIDLLILCSGSQSDMLSDAPYFAKHFNIINTFDTHSLIAPLYSKLNSISKKSKHIAILSTGWDPGLFSIARLTFANILKKDCTCFWGKGVSMGHSQAVKHLNFVEDAISITAPCSKALKAIYKNKPLPKDLHYRKVYVVSQNKHKNSQIQSQIKNMPHYFKNQKVQVKFVSQKSLNNIKNLKHKGEVFCSSANGTIQLKVNMPSNPNFTACIVLSFARSFKNIQNKYKYGAYTPLHFAPIDFATQPTFKTIKKYC